MIFERFIPIWISCRLLKWKFGSELQLSSYLFCMLKNFFDFDLYEVIFLNEIFWQTFLSNISEFSKFYPDNMEPQTDPFLAIFSTRSGYIFYTV